MYTYYCYLTDAYTPPLIPTATHGSDLPGGMQIAILNSTKSHGIVADILPEVLFIHVVHIWSKCN